jgi:2'-5' RNA ligase
MAYLVVAYPKLSPSDFDWIQEYRKQNDPRYFNVINPHFTLVFAIGDIEKEVFLEEARKQVADIRRFDFDLKVATINLDDSKEYYHEFLVPDKGYSNIIKLHDRLYSETLSKYLRLDLDFIPHIGIGNSDDAHTSKGRVDALNKKEIDISGTVDTVDVIEYKDGVVSTVEVLSLA